MELKSHRTRKKVFSVFTLLALLIGFLTLGGGAGISGFDRFCLSVWILCKLLEVQRLWRCFLESNVSSLWVETMMNSNGSKEPERQ